MTDTERLNFVVEQNVMLRLSPETFRWVASFTRNSQTHIFPATTLREAIDQAREFADNQSGN